VGNEANSEELPEEKTLQCIEMCISEQHCVSQSWILGCPSSRIPLSCPRSAAACVAEQKLSREEGITMPKLSLIRALLFTLMLMCLSAASFAQIGVSVSFGPPALPVYEQPICPEDGYIWTPGYWAWDGNNYYWVDGTWVESPEVGFLWTPGYWGWGGDAFLFHEGYWGPHVGYYGGINYGYGYGGRGYEGGRWENNHFYYNTSVNRINNQSVHNTYNTRVENTSGSRVSYNGGNGGVNARPSTQEDTYDKERHTGPVAAQNQHVQQARSDPKSRAATSRPEESKGNSVPAKEVSATSKAPERTAPANEARPANNSEARANANIHANEVQPHKYAAPAAGNPATDQKYQQQQDKLAAKQNQEHQKLQQQQQKEHQQAAAKNTSEPQKQQMEQRHAQQTQQLEQKHTSQQQNVQTHQQQHQSAPPPQNHPPAQKP
jgi:WXXGXW repeat (2 copies)